MTLVKWAPRTSLMNLNSELDRWMDNIFGSNVNYDYSDSVITPVVNIEETENHFQISAELPGLEKKDIQISVENNVLSISGEKKHDSETKDRNFHRIERSYGKFNRSFKLPNGIDTNNIDASYKNGVLTLSLPKMEEAKPKQIEVKVK